MGVVGVVSTLAMREMGQQQKDPRSRKTFLFDKQIFDSSWFCFFLISIAIMDLEFQFDIFH